MNYLAILVAAVTVFVLGWLWYSPLMFYKPWMRLRGLDPVAAMAGAKMSLPILLIEFARCVVLAYMLACLAGWLGISTWMSAAHLGLFLWFGFPVILLTGSVIWEKVRWKVAAIHAGDWLVKLLVTAIIVTVWR